MSLDELFKSIPDFRRDQGQRYELDTVLWMIFLGVASGYQGYWAIAPICPGKWGLFYGLF
ncbi:MAG: transposase family protein [Cytophagaceae bacterium]|nr:transposase family protein [Cytophagaceae bacterium]